MEVSPENDSMGEDSKKSDNSGADIFDFHESSTRRYDYTCNALKEILFRTSELYEMEVHQLAFALDIFSIEEYGQEILGVSYTPDYHGVYSREVSLSLQDLANNDEIEAKTVIYKGRSIVKCNRKEEVQMDDLSSEEAEDLKSIVFYVLSDIKGDFDTSVGIRKWVRNHRARNNADFGEKIDLDAYLDDIHEQNRSRSFSEPNYESLPLPENPSLFEDNDE